MSGALSLKYYLDIIIDKIYNNNEADRFNASRVYELRNFFSNILLKHNRSCLFLNLRGRVQFPTGGNSPRAVKTADLDEYQSRQYSLEGRRLFY